MTLLEEYRNQNIWRDWERYLIKLPLTPEQTVFDLGCSIGVVTNQLARKVKKAIGFDNDQLLLEAARNNKPDNCAFIHEDIFTSHPSQFGKCDGIWTSFALAYMKEPDIFISNWMKCLNVGGWFAVVDIDGFFSSHLSEDGKYFEEIERFEKASERSGVYDFRIGRKIKDLMEQNGLELIVEENDWYDQELNFDGSATPEVVQNWAARLDRMVSLKSYFGTEYPDFCRYFLDTISRERHTTTGGVRFCAGIKNRSG